MAVVRFSPQARQDLQDIFHYIAADNPHRALSFTYELEEACHTRARLPRSGKQEPDLRPGILWFAHAGYVFYYRALPDGPGIRVLRVFHGARDHRRAMRDEPAGEATGA
jgi:toxin ParE1/3/4